MEHITTSIAIHAKGDEAPIEATIGTGPMSYATIDIGSVFSAVNTVVYLDKASAMKLYLEASKLVNHFAESEGY